MARRSSTASRGTCWTRPAPTTCSPCPRTSRRPATSCSASATTSASRLPTPRTCAAGCSSRSSSPRRRSRSCSRSTWPTRPRAGASRSTRESCPGRSGWTWSPPSRSSDAGSRPCRHVWRRRAARPGAPATTSTSRRRWPRWRRCSPRTGSAGARWRSWRWSATSPCGPTSRRACPAPIWRASTRPGVGWRRATPTRSGTWWPGSGWPRWTGCTTRWCARGTPPPRAGLPGSWASGPRIQSGASPSWPRSCGPPTSSWASSAPARRSTSWSTRSSPSTSSPGWSPACGR